LASFKNWRITYWWITWILPCKLTLGMSLRKQFFSIFHSKSAKIQSIQHWCYSTSQHSINWMHNRQAEWQRKLSKVERLPHQRISNWTKNANLLPISDYQIFLTPWSIIWINKFTDKKLLNKSGLYSILKPSPSCINK